LRTGEGRRAWLREAKRQLEQERAADPKPVSRDRPKRVKEAKRRLEEELFTEVRANAAYERYRSGRMKDGRPFSRRPNPYTPLATPQGQVNLTDPDSAVVKGSRGRGFMQGYNAQAVANEHQIVIGRRSDDHRPGLWPSRTDARRRRPRTPRGRRHPGPRGPC
jgi:hypothetical protein